MNSPELERLLELRYQAPAWATFRELRCGAEYNGERRIDFAAWAMWDSLSGRSVAVEVKRSRSDFMREIEQPQKREHAEKSFGECYFCVPRGLVATDEVPAGWGLLEATKKGDKLRRVKVAQQRTDVTVSTLIMNAVLRRAAKMGEEVRMLNEEVQAMQHAGHGVGCCVGQDRFDELQRSFDAEHERCAEAWRRLSELEGPLWQLANLASAHGVVDWTPGIVRDLLARAVAAEISGRLMRDIKQAHRELGRLLQSVGSSR